MLRCLQNKFDVGIVSKIEWKVAPKVSRGVLDGNSLGAGEAFQAVVFIIVSR
jgi:hypothetical protein